MAARHGRNGRVYADVSAGGSGSAEPVVLMNSWSIDQSIDTVEVTSFGDTNKQYVAGLPDAQGAFSGFWDSADNNLYNLIGSSVARKLYIYPDRSNDESDYFFTTAYLSVSHEGGTDSAVSRSFQWVAASEASWVTS